ncbi:MAG: hypothetical protein IT352_13560 [Gemmatimonadales bacterium]|nr:hypothetical protein [Gemmatimonadales bacterium]
MFRWFLIWLVASTTSLARGEAQTPASRVPRDLPGPRVLPPGPTVTDWQPRGRAVVGGTIVLTGTGFQPATFEAVIGPSKFRLPVKASSSSASRIELEVPDAALGKLGALVVGHPGTQGTTVEASYRIDPPMPSLLEVTTGTPLVPDLVKAVTVRIKEFPGPRVNVDDITWTGCFFTKRPNTSFGIATREADLSIRITVQGWFSRSGPCELRVSARALSETGAYLAPATVAVPITVAPLETFTLENTTDLASKLGATVIKAGVGNLCSADSGPWPGGGPVGLRSLGGDLFFIARGNLIDVRCAFRTNFLLLPRGVRLERIEFTPIEVGNRCGLGGNFNSTLPTVSLGMGRGSATVNPFHDGDAEQFTASGHETIEEDGVIHQAGLSEPRTGLLPMIFDFQCAPMTVPLHTTSGLKPPTLEPQSFGIRVDRIVFRGPPGMTAAAITQ